MPEDKDPLNTWVTNVTSRDMPVFGRTVQSVICAAESESSNVTQLAQVILQDPAMTSRVLKMSNSVYYNPSSDTVSTASRAIVLLGFEAVRNICLTISLVDSMVTGQNREQLTHEMAKAMHAAIQARNIAEQREDNSPEEIFVATLLSNVGRMAFWSFAGDEAQQLHKRLEAPDIKPERAEIEVLGFPLKELSKSLIKEWGLNGLLHDILNSPNHADPRVKNIMISHRLAESSHGGWHSPEAKKAIKEVADFLSQPVKTVSEFLLEGAKDAAEVATNFGATNIAKAIPVPPGLEPDTSTQDKPDGEKADHLEADPVIQLDILSQIKELLNGNPTFNTLLEMVLEGIYRGVGMDRTLFALMTPDHKMLRAKYALGTDHEQLTEEFAFPLSKQEPNIFLYAMVKKKPIRVQPQKDRDLARMLTPEINNLLGTGELLVAPLVVNNRPIGIIYADRIASQREVDTRTLQSFGHFAAEANMGLDYITKQQTMN